jgi:biotin transport system permease protein
MIGALSARPTPFHSWPAGYKLAGLCLLCTAIGFAPWFWVGWLGLAIVLLSTSLAGGWFLRLLLGDLKAPAIIALLILLWHGFAGRLEQGLSLSGTLLACIGAAAMLSRTTRPSDLQESIDRILEMAFVGPRLRCRLSLAISLTLRFGPTLSERAFRLREAHRSRSPRRVGWRLLPPLALGALDEADRAAKALRARAHIE